jgi:hypothetical protein
MLWETELMRRKNTEQIQLGLSVSAIGIYTVELPQLLSSCIFGRVQHPL